MKFSDKPDYGVEPGVHLFESKLDGVKVNSAHRRGLRARPPPFGRGNSASEWPMMTCHSPRDGGVDAHGELSVREHTELRWMCSTQVIPKRRCVVHIEHHTPQVLPFAMPSVQQQRTYTRFKEPPQGVKWFQTTERAPRMLAHLCCTLAFA